MRAILLVDHGSRRDEANAQLDTLADLVRARMPDVFTTTAHLELISPSVAEGIAACVNAGALEIALHPFFLAPGRHSSVDLPRLAREGAARHPGVSIRVGPPLGLHPQVVDAVLERIAQAFSAPEAERSS
jgi:sirohydrochlorin cobaltochelatase